MSFTRLAGARSSSGFLAKRVLPSGSSRSTASAESSSGRPSATGRPCAVAMKGATAAASTARTASIRPGCTEEILASERRGHQGKIPQRTACFISFDGLKRGMRPATITVWPVRGFFTVRGLRRATENVPKPTRVTGSPRFSEARMPASAARSARSDPALGHPEASDIRLTISALVISALHPKRAPGLVHHGLVDSRVAVLGREALDRAPGHRPDERGYTLDPRFGLRRPDDARRHRGRRLIDHRGEGTRGRLGARAGDLPFERVGPRPSHHRPHVLERRGCLRCTAAELHAEASHHLGLERIGQHRYAEAAFGTAEGDGQRALVRTLGGVQLHRLVAIETQKFHAPAFYHRGLTAARSGRGSERSRDLAATLAIRGGLRAVAYFGSGCQTRAGYLPASKRRTNAPTARGVSTTSRPYTETIPESTHTCEGSR